MDDIAEFSRKLPDDFYLELGKILTNCGYMDVLFDGFLALCSFDETIEDVLKKYRGWTLGHKKKTIGSLIEDLKKTKLGDLYFGNLDFKPIQAFIDRRNEIVHSYYGSADGKVFRLKSNSIEEEITIEDLQKLGKQIKQAEGDLVGLQSIASGYREIFTNNLIAFVKSEERICPKPQPWNWIFEELSKFATETQFIPKPLILAAWNKTSDGQKQARLIEQIRFAGDHGGLGKLDNTLRTLPKNDWLCST